MPMLAARMSTLSQVIDSVDLPREQSSHPYPSIPGLKVLAPTARLSLTVCISLLFTFLGEPIVLNVLDNLAAGISLGRPRRSSLL